MVSDGTDSKSHYNTIQYDRKIFIFIAAVLWTYCLSAATKQPEQIIPVPFNEVTLTGGFWGERMQTELDVTLPFSLVQAGPAIEQLQGGADFLEGRGGQSISNNGPLSSDLYKSWKERPIR